MPTILSAKDIVEQALKKIGRFPSTMEQADAGDLREGYTMLELILQSFYGEGSNTSAWGTIQVPLLSSNRVYALKLYERELAAPGIQFVYDAELLEVASGAVTPLNIINEEKYFKLNLKETGTPTDIYINKGPDVADTLMQTYPTLGAEVAANTYKILLHVQTYATRIDRATGAAKINIRPTLYLWAIKRLAYELGTGTLRRLPKIETDQLKVDYEELEIKLSAFDNAENDNQPYTKPWGQ